MYMQVKNMWFGSSTTTYKYATNKCRYVISVVVPLVVYSNILTDYAIDLMGMDLLKGMLVKMVTYKMDSYTSMEKGQCRGK